ncbi:hypothetical protein KY317_02515 [Candidatus Woesearchaeota archaeon]|nr:hypothetical protein [Candidatus Woesearchaeota archaeon]
MVIKVKKRLKSLLPALKEKNRYLVFEIISDNKIRDIKAVSGQIKTKMTELIGNLGMAKANIRILNDKFKPNRQKGIIKVNHKHVHELKSALAMIDKLKGKKAVVRSVGLSGILKKAESKYMAS